MDFTFSFLKTFLYGLYYTAPLLLLIMLTTICLGQIVGRIESWKKFDALYWSFITATTVGYGDIRPSSRTSKALSVIIALTGLIFTGIIVAIAVRSATYAFNIHVDFFK
ncbi:MAG: two pore domain potassium channel family protein [Deltaproteobacteria bacterium]|nr:two pore domain potassium channel family protein [Deltaproteobacteria bacterium]